MPSSPPVTSGLSVWLCSDTNVDMRPDGTVVTWGTADGSGIQAVAIGSSRPQYLGGQINGWPVLRFSGAQALFLATGAIAQDSFTLVVVGRSFDPRSQGGSGISGQKMVFYQDGSQSQTNASVSVGWNGVGIYEFGSGDYPRAEASADAACFCPLVVRYEGKYLNVWLTGTNVISNNMSYPSQPVGVPHGIGGTGDATGGFVGDIAEVLIYNRSLNDWERQMVEQYVQAKYACGSSSSEESSSSSSEWSSEQSSEQSSSSSSSEESSWSSEWSSEQSSWSSEWSSESPSSSEESSSSSCSCQMPSDPVPVTDGLVAWQRSDLNVNTDGSGVVSWGPVCDCLPNMVRVSSAGPQVVANAFGSYPGVQFDLGQAQQLSLMSSELGNNNFTLFVVARPEADRVWNGNGVSGQRLLLSDNGGSGAHAALSAGQQSLGLYEFEYSGNPRLEAWLAGCLCPVVVQYENKQASLYVSGALIAQDNATPWYDIFIPRSLGGWINADPNAGFVGEVAEVIFYNRALSDYERQLVESYVQNRYGCLISSSSSSDESSSDSSSSSDESSSSSDESSWSSQESSWESSWESSAESSYEPPSSSCSPVLPPDPVPVTDGLVAWQRADTNVSLDGNNQVTNWGGADGCLPDAQRVTYAGPGWQAASFGVQPAVVFSGTEGLLLEAGELGADNFTMVVVACSDLMSGLGSLFAPGSSQNNAVAAVAANMGQVELSEPGGNGAPRLTAQTPGCLCPLTIIYENKQARMYWLGNLVAQDSSIPPYSIWLAKLVGGIGSGGFVGRMAEMLFYNRALNDFERQQVENYLISRYQCLPSYSSDTSSEESSEQSNSSEMSSGEEESSSSSSSSSSQQSGEGDSSSSEYSSESSESSEGLIYFTQSAAELLNPTATDYDWTMVGFVNETGREVATVEFEPEVMGAPAFVLAAAEGTGDDPVTITGKVVNEDTLSIQAAAWGVNTDYGKAGFVGKATFKDSMEGVIAKASLGIDIDASLMGMLEKGKQEAGLNSSVQFGFSIPFQQEVEGMGFFDQNAAALVELGIRNAIISKNAQFKLELNASLDGLNNISLKRIVGTAGFEVTLIQGTALKTSTFGNFQELFTPQSKNVFQFTWEGGIVIQGMNNQKIFGVLDGIKIKAQSSNEDEPPSAGVSIELNDSGEVNFVIFKNVPP